MPTIAESLISITGVKNIDQTSDFLDSMVAAINDLSEDDWNKLPDGGKSWFNEAAKIIENTDEGTGYKLPLIPGMDLQEAEPEKNAETEAEPEKNAETEAVVEKEETEAVVEKEETEAVVEKEETEAVVEKEEQKIKKSKRTGPPVTQIAREIFCSDISMTLEELILKLDEQDIVIKKSTAQNVYLNALRSFETAQKLGMVKKAGKVVLEAK